MAQSIRHGLMWLGIPDVEGYQLFSTFRTGEKIFTINCATPTLKIIPGSLWHAEATVNLWALFRPLLPFTTEI